MYEKQKQTKTKATPVAKLEHAIRLKDIINI